MKLEETIRALFDVNVEFVLIGGAAMQMQGSAHLTEDLDFCYARSAKNLERLALALAPHRPRLRGAPENLPFRFDAAAIKRGLNFTLMRDSSARKKPPVANVIWKSIQSSKDFSICGKDPKVAKRIMDSMPTVQEA